MRQITYRRGVGAIVALALLVIGTTSASAADRVVASGAKPVSWVDDGCYIHVHRGGWRLPKAELHIQCTLNTESEGEGAVIKYRYPKRGVPTSFGVRIEEYGHGLLGDLPYLSAWQDPEHPRIGYLHVPGPHTDRPNGTYVHSIAVVWNGNLDDEVVEVFPPPYDETEE